MTARRCGRGMGARVPRKVVGLVAATSLMSPTLTWDAAAATEPFVERCDEMAWVRNWGEGEVAETWIGSRDGAGSNLSVALGISDEASAITDWSPDGRSVLLRLWDAEATTPRYRLGTAAAVGGDVTEIAADSDGAPISVETARWSPDGEWVAVVGRLEGESSSLWVVPTPGGEATWLGFTRQGETAPTWSPDSSELAWAGNTSPSDFRLVVANRDGSDFRRFAEDGLQPAWSPAGSHLAWIADGAGTTWLFLLDADLSSTRPVSRQGWQHNNTPSWSPDGTTVVWSGRPSGADSIEILAYDTTTDEISVLASTGTKVNMSGKYPTWSADGRSVSWREHGALYDRVAIWSAETGAISTPFDAAEGPREILWRPSPFSDVPRDSFASADIACLGWLGLTTGTSASTYSPDSAVTREQMAAFLARLWRELGFDCPTGDDPFIDVATDSYARTDVSCIFQLGITTGTTATTYSPNAPVTREQMASFLARLWRGASPRGN